MSVVFSLGLQLVDVAKLGTHNGGGLPVGVARHRQVDHQRWCALQSGEEGLPQERLACRGGRHDDVYMPGRCQKGIQGQSTAAARSRQSNHLAHGSVDEEKVAPRPAAQMLATLTCHFAGSDESHCGRYLGPPVDEIECQRNHGHRPSPKRGLAAHTLGRLESLFEHHLQVGAGQPQPLCHVQRIFDLAQDLGIAGVERVEARSHTEEVLGGAVFFVGVQALGCRAGGGLVCRSSLAARRKEPVNAPAILGNRGAPPAQENYLNPIAGSQVHAFEKVARRMECLALGLALLWTESVFR